MGDRYATAIKRLCEREGGYRAVGEAAGVNGQTLYQIATGIKLPSGRARSAGPELRSKLDKAFPGWDADSAAASVHARRSPALQPVYSIEQSVKVLGAALSRVDGARRRMVVGALQAMLDRPEDSNDVAASIVALIGDSAAPEPPAANHAEEWQETARQAAAHYDLQLTAGVRMDTLTPAQFLALVDQMVRAAALQRKPVNA